MPELLWWQWGLGALAALLVGCAKTGVPGLGVLVVPLMATAFGARPSVGTLLPLLIVADCFAVCWYRRHAQWRHIVRLIPWLLPGMALGAWVLAAVDGWRIAGLDGARLFAPLIGLVVLVMLGLLLARRRLGERMTPRHPLLLGATGAGTGFATTLANAAGPIMTLYLTGMGLPKQQFMGTAAWFFLLVNLSKVPLYAALSLWGDGAPLFTRSSLTIDLLLAPLILVGVFVGRWLLPKLSQRLFDRLVLALAGLAALKLLTTPWTG